MEGAEINKAKETLAYEVTKLVHGEEEAKKALAAAQALFSGKGTSQDIPFTEIEKAKIEAGIDVLTLLMETGLIASKGEGRRLIQQGGLYLEEERIEDIGLLITTELFKNDKIMFRKGKKVYHEIRLVKK